MSEVDSEKRDVGQMTAEDGLRAVKELMCEGQEHAGAQRYAEAAEAYKSAIRICEMCKQEADGAFQPLLASSVFSLAYVYDRMNRYWETEEAYKRAFGLYEELSKQQYSKTYTERAARCCALLANFYGDMRFEEAAEAYRNAIARYASLAKEEPAAYEPDLAFNYYMYASLNCDAERDEEGTKAYLNAIEVYERLAKKEPELYEPDIALCYRAIGHLAEGIDDARMLSMYHKAYDLARKYPQNFICSVMAEGLKPYFEEEE